MVTYLLKSVTKEKVFPEKWIHITRATVTDFSYNGNIFMKNFKSLCGVKVHVTYHVLYSENAIRKMLLKYDITLTLLNTHTDFFYFKIKIHRYPRIYYVVCIKAIIAWQVTV